ncbi:MAG: hypothetical protein ACR2NV_10190 [Thermoleophilaceae bacterium]
MSVASEDTPLSRSIGGLDLGSRALLDLSLRRGVSDVEIALLLGIDPSDVARRRTVLLERIAADLGVTGSAARRRLDDDLREALASGERRGAAPPAAPAPDESPSAGTGRPASEGALAARAERPGVVLALLAVTVAGALVLVLLFIAQRPRDQPDAPGGGRSAVPRAVALRPLGVRSGSAGGTARIVGRGASARLELSLRGLPRRRGTLEVWLYSSQTVARPLARAESGTSTVRVRLPPGFERFRFVDLSAEPPDGNGNHSGQSILRAPIDALRASP